ncbi:MAG: hydrogenase expression/formation protein [Gammaproteobacteria bacterium]|nr:hydrogenase expression/formation protein [Gammaproteobacteria bacterium]MDH3428441.1 hydrogenase expression/formation protein [Gammaproteobacteria bacterium]MDH3432629.1 hydrogenase expression/formation protein [Gammaproteobacteria bacterium]
MSDLDAIPVSAEVTTGNVEPLLHEIRHALKRLAGGEDGTVIDLQRLPLAPGEEQRIEAVLGEGEVRAEINALGPTLVQETAYPGVWLITHRNAEESVIARFIEVTDMPELLKSQRADIESGINKLESELADSTKKN